MLIWTAQTCVANIMARLLPPLYTPLELQTWIGHFGLSEADKQILVSGGWLNANIIGAASILLKTKFRMVLKIPAPLAIGATRFVQVTQLNILILLLLYHKIKVTLLGQGHCLVLCACVLFT